MVGGDPPGGYPKQGTWIDDRGNELPQSTHTKTEDTQDERGPELDQEHDLQHLVYDFFCEGDRLMFKTEHTDEDNNHKEIEEEHSKKLDLLDELSRRASKIVYARSSISILSATIILVNMAIIHGVTNTYMDEFSKYLNTIHLPKANFLL